MAVIVTKNGDEILVDDADFEEMSRISWFINRGGHAQGRRHIEGKRRTVYMHRELMGLAIGDTRQVDHVNCMKLDNRRINLRVCTIAENQRNRGKNKNNKSGFKGVTYFKFAKLWKAQICINRETLFLGYFKNPEDAHRAYCEAAAKHHGEFAKT